MAIPSKVGFQMLQLDNAMSVFEACSRVAALVGVIYGVVLLEAASVLCR